MSSAVRSYSYGEASPDGLYTGLRAETNRPMMRPIRRMELNGRLLGGLQVPLMGRSSIL